MVIDYDELILRKISKFYAKPYHGKGSGAICHVVHVIYATEMRPPVIDRRFIIALPTSFCSILQYCYRKHILFNHCFVQPETISRIDIDIYSATAIFLFYGLVCRIA